MCLIKIKKKIFSKIQREIKKKILRSIRFQYNFRGIKILLDICNKENDLVQKFLFISLQDVSKMRIKKIVKTLCDIETQGTFTKPRLTMFNGKLVVMQLISHNATLAAIWKSVLREDNTLSYCECRIISYCDTLRRRYVWVYRWYISAGLFNPLLSLSNHFFIPTLIFNPQLSYFSLSLSLFLLV